MYVENEEYNLELNTDSSHKFYKEFIRELYDERVKSIEVNRAGLAALLSKDVNSPDSKLKDIICPKCGSNNIQFKMIGKEKSIMRVKCRECLYQQKIKESFWWDNLGLSE